MIFNLLLHIILVYSISTKRTIKRYDDINITLLDQMSSNKLPRLPCQNITDFENFPVLKVVDDFIIPPMSTFLINSIPYGIDNCRCLYFSIFYFRSKNNDDPNNITLYIMNDNNKKPGNIIFQKTYKKPINDWNINVYDPSTLLLKVYIGDKDDFNREFDISSSSLNYGTRLWVSFSVTMNRNFSLTGYRENMMYWIIYKIPEYKQLIPGELESPYMYYNSTLPYYFIDYNNLLNKDMVSWTIASETENRFKMEKTSLNMAFKVFLLCKKTIYDIDINITDSPTVVPTSQPSTITIQPTTIPTNTNKTDYSNKDVLWILIIILIVVVLCTIYVGLYFYRKYCKNQNYDNNLVDDLIKNGATIEKYNPVSSSNNINTTNNNELFINPIEITIDIPLDGKTNQ